MSPMEKHKCEKLDLSKQEENIFKTQKVAEKAFPNEKWIDATEIKLNHIGEDFQLPSGIVGIEVARSRLTGLKNDEVILAKEIRQANILANKGSSIYLLPKRETPNGNYLSGPDAIVDGILFEFKTITGPIGKVERRFRESRNQCENVFLKIESIKISKIDVVEKISAILKDVNYRMGIKGKLIFYLAGTKETYLMRIKDIL